MNSVLKAAWQGAEQTRPAAAISSGWGNAENDATYTVIDAETSIPHNEPMSTVTKDLLDARLETIEARMDARMAHIEGLVGNIAQSQADMRREMDSMRSESKAENKSTRTTMLVTGISSVLAIVLGVGAFNATVLSNMVASFESGKNTATMQTASEKALIEATKALEAATAKAQQVASPSQ